MGGNPCPDLPHPRRLRHNGCQAPQLGLRPHMPSRANFPGRPEFPTSKAYILARTNAHAPPTAALKRTYSPSHPMRMRGWALQVPPVPMEDHAKWKYLVNTDGQSASWRFAKLLSINSVILNFRSENIEYYYRRGRLGSARRAHGACMYIYAHYPLHL